MNFSTTFLFIEMLLYRHQFQVLQNVSQCLTPYDIQFLECNLTTANSFIMIGPEFIFPQCLSSVLSLLHYLIDKTSYYFDTLDM